MSLLYVFLGGGLGSLSRFGITKLFYSEQFPVGTLIANFLACVVMVLAMFFLFNKQNSQLVTYFVLIGFCGGFSTFSTFSLETFQFLKMGNYLYAGLNILISITMCLSVFYILKDKI